MHKKDYEKYFLKKIIRTVMTTEKPHVRIGKRGVHDKLVEHVRNILQSRGIIKIRVLKNVAETKEDVKKFAEELIKRLGNFAHLGEIRGRSIVLYSPQILEKKMKTNQKNNTSYP